MRKLLILPMLLLFPLAAGAAGIPELEGQLQQVGGEAYGQSGEPQDLTVTIGIIINVFLGVLGIIFLILTIYAGFLWMTASGSEDRVKKAKDILSTSIIGLVIILAAYAISNFVVSELVEATGTQ